MKKFRSSKNCRADEVEVVRPLVSCILARPDQLKNVRVPVQPPRLRLDRSCFWGEENCTLDRSNPAVSRVDCPAPSLRVSVASPSSPHSRLERTRSDEPNPRTLNAPSCNSRLFGSQQLPEVWLACALACWTFRGSTGNTKERCKIFGSNFRFRALISPCVAENDMDPSVA